MNLLPSIKLFLMLMLGELCSSVHTKFNILSSIAAINNAFISDRLCVLNSKKEPTICTRPDVFSIPSYCLFLTCQTILLKQYVWHLPQPNLNLLPWIYFLLVIQKIIIITIIIIATIITIIIISVFLCFLLVA